MLRCSSVDKLNTRASVSGRGRCSTIPPSTRRTVSQWDLSSGDKEKTLTAPGVKETKVLHDMATSVLHFLTDYGYALIPQTVQEFKQVPVKRFLDMIRFASEFLVGTKFFNISKNLKDDLCTKILEMTQIVRYPGRISKSQLQSANTPHVWPICLTLLTWLCSRVRAALESRTETPQVEMTRKNIRKIAFPQFLELFELYDPCKSLEEQSDALKNKTKEEIRKFRELIGEMLNSEVQLSTNELLAQKEEKLAQLAELKDFSDPSKEEFEAVINAKIRLEETKKKACESMNRVATYQDVNSFKSKLNTLKMQIITRELEIEGINEEVSSQPLTRENVENLIAETIDLKKQRERLHAILTKLESDLQKKKQIDHNLDQRFGETIAKFAVVEQFNDQLSNLDLHGLYVSANPLNANDLERWLDKVETIQEETAQTLQTLKEVGKSELVQQKQVEATVDQKLATCSNIEAISKSKLKFAQKNLTVQENQFQRAKEDRIAYMSNLTQNRKKHEAKAEELLRNFDSKSEELQQFKKTKERKEECSKAWNSNVCEWSDGLLYAETANAQHAIKSEEAIVEKAREYAMKKYKGTARKQLFETRAQEYLSSVSGIFGLPYTSRSATISVQGQSFDHNNNNSPQPESSSRLSGESDCNNNTLDDTLR